MHKQRVLNWLAKHAGNMGKSEHERVADAVDAMPIEWDGTQVYVKKEDLRKTMNQGMLRAMECDVVTYMKLERKDLETKHGEEAPK